MPQLHISTQLLPQYCSSCTMGYHTLFGDVQDSDIDGQPLTDLAGALLNGYFLRVLTVFQGWRLLSPVSIPRPFQCKVSQAVQAITTYNLN